METNRLRCTITIRLQRRKKRKKKRCIRVESYRDRQQWRSGRTFKETRYRCSRLFSLCSRLEPRACPYITPRYLRRAFTRVARNFHLANFSLCVDSTNRSDAAAIAYTVTRKSIPSISYNRFDLISLHQFSLRFGSLLLFLLWFKFDLVQNQVKLNIMFNVKFVLILIQTNYTKKIPQRRIILRRKKTTN